MRWKVFLTVLLVFAVFTACSDDPVSSDRVLGPQEEAFNTHVRTLGDIQQASAAPAPTVTSVSTNDTDVPPEGSDYKIVTTTYEAAVGFNEILALNPGSDVIYPGSILDGDSIASGTYDPIIAYRMPLTVSVSLMNLQGNCSIIMKNPSISSYRTAIKQLLQQEMSGPSAARVSFTMEEVSDSRQLAIALGAKFDSAASPVSVGGNFNYSTTSSNCNILVKFIQVYYTVDIDIPVRPTDFFAEDNDWSWLEGQMTNTSPVYVSSISYGRMALFSVQSSQSASKLKAALNAAFSVAKVGEVGVNVSVEHQNTLSDSTIQAYIIGGNGVDAVASISGFENFKTYLNNGANYSSDTPAAPISYKLRYLKDNKISDIVLTSTYNVAKSVRVANVNKYKVTGVKLKCGTEDDFGDNAEFFGKIKVTAFTGDVTNATFTNAVSLIDGYSDGYPSNGILWNIPRDQSENWAMPAEGSKDISGDITFSFDLAGDASKTFIRVEGELYEDDGFWGGYKYMGSFSKTVSLDAYINGSTDTYQVTGFATGGTTASVEFKIAPVQ